MKMLWRIVWGTYTKGNGDKVPRVEHSVGCNLLGSSVRPDDGSRCVLVFFDDSTWLWIIPICNEGRVVGSRTAVVYVRLALVQANPDSVSLVEARGLPIFLLLQNTECGSGLSSPRRTCGIAGAVAANS